MGRRENECAQQGGREKRGGEKRKNKERRDSRENKDANTYEESSGLGSSPNRHVRVCVFVRVRKSAHAIEIERARVRLEGIRAREALPVQIDKEVKQERTR